MMVRRADPAQFTADSTQLYRTGGSNGTPSIRAPAIDDSVTGGGGIRTPETLSRLTVFKTVAFSRSATPPDMFDLNLDLNYSLW